MTTHSVFSCSIDRRSFLRSTWSSTMSVRSADILASRLICLWRVGEPESLKAWLVRFMRGASSLFDAATDKLPALENDFHGTRKVRGIGL